MGAQERHLWEGTWQQAGGACQAEGRASADVLGPKPLSEVEREKWPGSWGSMMEEVGGPPLLAVVRSSGSILIWTGSCLRGLSKEWHPVICIFKRSLGLPFEDELHGARGEEGWSSLPERLPGM